MWKIKGTLFVSTPHRYCLRQFYPRTYLPPLYSSYPRVKTTPAWSRYRFKERRGGSYPWFVFVAPGQRLGSYPQPWKKKEVSVRTCLKNCFESRELLAPLYLNSFCVWKQVWLSSFVEWPYFWENCSVYVRADLYRTQFQPSPRHYPKSGILPYSTELFKKKKKKE